MKTTTKAKTKSKTKSKTETRVPQLDVLNDRSLIEERRQDDWYKCVIRSPKVFLEAAIEQADQLYPDLKGYAFGDLLYTNPLTDIAKKKAAWIRYVITRTTADAVKWHYKRGHFNPEVSTDFLPICEKAWDAVVKAYKESGTSCVDYNVDKENSGGIRSHMEYPYNRQRRVLRDATMFSCWTTALGGGVEQGVFNFLFKLLGDTYTERAEYLTDGSYGRGQILPFGINDQGHLCAVTGDRVTDTINVRLPGSSRNSRVHSLVGVITQGANLGRLCFDPSVAFIKRGWYDLSLERGDVPNERGRNPALDNPNRGGLYRRAMKGTNTKWFPVSMYPGLTQPDGYYDHKFYLNDYVCAGVTKNLSGGDTLSARSRCIFPLFSNGPRPNTVVLSESGSIRRFKYKLAGPKTKELIRSIPVGSISNNNFLKDSFQSEFEGTIHKVLADSPISANTLALFGAVFVEGVPTVYSRNYVTVKAEEYTAKWREFEAKVKTDYFVPANQAKGIYITNYTDVGDMKFIPSKEEAGSDANWIGFEVEKKTFRGKGRQGDFVGDCRIFPAIVPDSSCGVEGKTHIFKLEQKGKTRNAFRKTCLVDKDLLDGPVDSSCGGHVNLSGPNLGDLDKIRPYSWVFLAMYRHRLKVSYTSHNKLLKKGRGGEKYSVVREHSDRLEFRLVPAVATAKQLMRRYDMFALLAEAVDTNMKLSDYYKKMRSILRGVYSDAKWSGVMYYASLFEDYGSGKTTDESDLDSPDRLAIRNFMG